MSRLISALSRFAGVVRAYPRISGTVGLGLAILTFTLLNDKKEPETDEFEFVPIDLVEQQSINEELPSLPPLTLSAAVPEHSSLPTASAVADETPAQTVTALKTKLPPQKNVEHARFNEDHPESPPSETSRAAWLTGKIEETPQPGIANSLGELEQYPFNRR